MSLKQISVFAENKKGSAFSALEILAEANIDLKALSISETAEYGIIRFIVSEPDKASEILKKNGCIIAVTDVIGVQMPNIPGGLSHILGMLSDAGINIEYLYAFITTAKEHAYVVLRVLDNSQAEKVLEAGGMTLLTGDDIDRL